MNRRSLIKNLVWLIGASAFAPSCLNSSNQKTIGLKNIALETDDQILISEICETLIPKTDTPGAKDLNLPEFVLKMLDETLPKSDQKNIILGLKDFKAFVLKKSGKSYTDLEPKEKEAILLELETKRNKPAAAEKPIPESPLSLFYSAIKSQTLFAYTTSQYFMTKVNIYELVPGRYKVHFPIKNLKTV